MSEVVEQQANELVEDGHSVTIFTLDSNRKPKCVDLMVMGAPKNNLSKRDKAKSIVIYNKINPAKFSAEVEYTSIREKYRLNEDSPSFLYVGRLSCSKGIKELINSFRYASNKLPNAKLIIVGRSYYSFNLNTFLEEIGNSENIIWTGQVSKEDLASLYTLCDVYVSASKWDGFGIRSWITTSSLWNF